MLKFFTLTLALPLVMFLSPFGSNDGKPASQFVFNADEEIRTLRGNWKFQTGDDPRWSRPDFPDADWRTMAVPGMWVNELEENYGIAWYRAWIEIPSSGNTSTEWAIKINQLHVAGEVYWDGQLIAQHGKVGSSKASEVPGPNNYLYTIAKGQSPGRYLLALRVSNFHSPTGGILRPPELGSYRALLAHHTGLKMLFGFYNEVRSTRDVFGLFVPEPVLDKIAKTGLNSIKLGGAEEGIATILFTDIRSFSAIAEKHSPNETLVFLNEFMTRMQPVIHANGGFINQFVGDEIMAIFYKSGHSDDAIQTAIAMRRALEEHNRERTARGEPPIDIGVGVHAGKVIWGTIGSEVRMESAIIGDTVNLASRLQSLTKHYGVGVLVSESAHQEISNPEKYCCRQVDVVQVKGKTQPVGIYEIFDADTEPLKTQKLQGLAQFHQALILFHANDWPAAQKQFEACFQLCPGDPIVRVYLERCREHAERPPTLEWRGVTVLHEK